MSSDESSPEAMLSVTRMMVDNLRSEPHRFPQSRNGEHLSLEARITRLEIGSRSYRRAQRATEKRVERLEGLMRNIVDATLPYIDALLRETERKQQRWGRRSSPEDEKRTTTSAPRQRIKNTMRTSPKNLDDSGHVTEKSCEEGTNLHSTVNRSDENAMMNLLRNKSKTEDALQRNSILTVPVLKSTYFITPDAGNDDSPRRKEKKSSNSSSSEVSNLSRSTFNPTIKTSTTISNSRSNIPGFTRFSTASCPSIIAPFTNTSRNKPKLSVRADSNFKDGKYASMPALDRSGELTSAKPVRTSTFPSKVNRSFDDRFNEVDHLERKPSKKCIWSSTSAVSSTISWTSSPDSRITSVFCDNPYVREPSINKNNNYIIGETTTSNTSLTHQNEEYIDHERGRNDCGIEDQLCDSFDSTIGVDQSCVSAHSSESDIFRTPTGDDGNAVSPISPIIGCTPTNENFDEAQHAVSGSSTKSTESSDIDESNEGQGQDDVRANSTTKDVNKSQFKVAEFLTINSQVTLTTQEGVELLTKEMMQDSSANENSRDSFVCVSGLSSETSSKTPEIEKLSDPYLIQQHTISSHSSCETLSSSGGATRPNVVISSEDASLSPIGKSSTDGNIEDTATTKLGMSPNAMTASLLKAANDGIMEQIMWLLGSGCPAGVRGRGGATGAHRAARQGHAAALQMLLRWGADPGTADDLGRTPLHRAAQSWNTQCVKMLLDAGANVNVRDTNGRSPLHEAAEWARVDAVRALLAAGADQAAVDAKGLTPKDLAATITVRRLLQYSRLRFR